MKEKNIMNIDDYLGDAESRFFGEGYKRVKYHLYDKILQDEIIEATIGIEYPENWSLKKKKKLKPHLSSIDALIVVTNLCGELLTKKLGSIKGCSINSITIIAGQAPSLELDKIAAKMCIADKQKNKNIDVFKFSGGVGQMKINVEVFYDCLNKTMKEPLLASDYLRGSFSNAKQRINDIKIKDVRARAQVKKYSTMLNLNSVDVVDAFVSSLQLGQVLLYEIDNIKRENSNNLWMRSIKVTKNHDRKSSSNNIVTVLDDLNITKFGEDNWRSANIVSKIKDIKINCSVAHQLSTKGRLHVH